MKRFLLLGFTLFSLSCDPLTQAILDEVLEETSNFKLINQQDLFYREADHHEYKGSEVYHWRNCGESAVVDAEVEPSCPNDMIVHIYDAEDALVFAAKFCAQDCWHGKKDWPPMVTSTGAPGVWRIELRFDLEDVKNLKLRIVRNGPPVVEVTGTALDESAAQAPLSDPHDDDPGSEPPPPDPAFLQWSSVCTYDRDVEESYPIPVDGGVASINASWETITAGSMEVVIKDAEGQVVYQAVIDGSIPSPISAVTAAGVPGTWKVTFRATYLTSTYLQVLVESPPPGP